jgi:hypothetical protein
LKTGVGFVVMRVSVASLRCFHLLGGAALSALRKTVSERKGFSRRGAFQ